MSPHDGSVTNENVRLPVIAAIILTRMVIFIQERFGFPAIFSCNPRGLRN